jgi:hypothetical protein
LPHNPQPAARWCAVHAFPVVLLRLPFVGESAMRKTPFRSLRLTVPAALALAAAGCATTAPGTPPSAAPAAPAAQASAPAPRAAASAPTAPPAPGQPQPFATMIKDARKIDGALTLWQKDEKFWIELTPADFGKPWLFAPKIAQGIGEAGLFGGTIIGP